MLDFFSICELFGSICDRCQYNFLVEMVFRKNENGDSDCNVLCVLVSFQGAAPVVDKDCPMNYKSRGAHQRCWELMPEGKFLLSVLENCLLIY